MAFGIPERMPRMVDIVFVLAGSHREWLCWVDHLDGVLKTDQDSAWTKDARYVYIDRVEKMYGYRAQRVMTIGTFYERPDATKLIDEAKLRTMPNNH